MPASIGLGTAQMAAALLGWAVFVAVAQTPKPMVATKPLVSLKDGKVLGLSRTFEGKRLHVFYGIPYARQPLAKLRFLPPSPVQTWRHVWNSRRMASPCMQRMGEIRYPIHLRSLNNASEDCLYLNVWAPVREAGSPASRAVVALFHGGGFSHGSTASMLYDGSAIAALGDLVVVTISYRLGIFGFLDAGHREAPGNVGLLDQRLALQWIRRNAEAFGGDPLKVTLLGLSAGAVSSGLHMASPLSRGLFQGAIMEGGGPFCAAFVEKSRKSMDRGSRLASLLGCAKTGTDLGSHPRKVLSCLRGRPASDLIWAQEKVSRSWMTSFVPTYGNVFLTKAPKKLKYQAVPLLIGTSRNEGSPFVGRQTFQDPPKMSNRSESLKLVAGLLDAYQVLLPKQRAPFEPYLKDGSPELRRLVSDAFGDATFHCPCKKFAAEHVKAGNPVYMYKFCYATASLNVPIWMGVPHSSTFWYMSGVPLRMPERFDDQDKKLSRDIIAMISEFATNGNPGNFLGQKWPTLPAGSSSLMHLSPDKPGIRKDERTPFCDYWNSDDP